MHSDKKLYLVFEYLDLDLKKHMDSHPAFGTDHRLVKVCPGCEFICTHIFAAAMQPLTYVSYTYLMIAVLLISDVARNRLLSLSQVRYRPL